MQKLLDGDSGRKSKQLVGFKSSMILDTRPQTDGRVQHLSLSCVRSKPILFFETSLMNYWIFLYWQELMYFSFTSYLLLVILFMETNFSFTSFSFLFCIFRQTRLHSIWHPRSNIRHGSFIFIFGFWFLGVC
jgi:hypothetical protein